jgi:hypothetical protein
MTAVGFVVAKIIPWLRPVEFKAPQREVHRPRRAIQPSRKSVAAARPTSPSRRLGSAATTKPAASRTRDDEMMFGRARSVARAAMLKAMCAFPCLPAQAAIHSFAEPLRNAP